MGLAREIRDSLGILAPYAPPQALSRLVSAYMRQLASGTTPWHLEIPRPDDSGQDQDIKNPFERLTLDINHRATFDFVQLALATEPQDSVTAELYKSFQALGARLAKSDEGPSSNSAHLNDEAPTNPKLSDELRDKMERVHAVYKERQEKIQKEGQAGPSTAVDQLTSSIRPELRPNDDRQQNGTSQGGIVEAESLIRDGAAIPGHLWSRSIKYLPY